MPEQLWNKWVQFVYRLCLCGVKSVALYTYSGQETALLCKNRPIRAPFRHGFSDYSSTGKSNVFYLLCSLFSTISTGPITITTKYINN